MLAKFKSYIHQVFKDWKYIFSSEIRTIFKDQGVLIFCILLPIIYPLIYTWIYNNEVVREVPTVVVDESQTCISRKYIREINATPDINIVANVPNMEDAKKMIKHRKAYGIIYIPRTFAKDIIKKIPTHINIFVDMSGLLYYKALVMSNYNVALSMSARIRASYSPSLSKEEHSVNSQRIAYKEVDLYNSQIGFASFLIPAVLVLILQQSLILAIGLSAGTTREKNKFHELAPINKHNNGLFRIVLGKAMAYFIVSIPNIAYVLGVVPHLFRLPQIGNEWEIFMLTLPFILAVIFFGMTISAFIKERETCFITIVFSSVPLLFLSGISWPYSSIPAFWKYVGYIFPSCFGVNAYVKINCMGAHFSDVKFELIVLWTQTIVFFITTLIVYRYSIISSRKKLIFENRKN